MLSPRALLGDDVQCDTLAALGELRQQGSLARAVLISSTRVYGDRDTGTVTAETPVRPDDERGRRILAIEQRWLSFGEKFYICRLAGLYGPGRIVGRRQLDNQTALPGTADGYLNLIHVEDAAQLAVICGTKAGINRIELGADGHPVRRHEYYKDLVRRLRIDAPVQFSPSARARRGYRCDPRSTIHRTAWALRFPDYRAGLTASLHAESEAGQGN